MAEKNTIKEILKQYKKHMDEQAELDALLLSDMDKREWIQCLQNRAIRIQEIFVENGILIEKLDELLLLPLTEESAAELYKETNEMYWDGYDDCQILLPLIHKLIAYYEDNMDLNRLLFLYGAAFYEENEIQNRRDGNCTMSMEYNLKILEYLPNYFDLDAAYSRKRYWGAFYNLIVVAMGNKVFDVNTAYSYLEKAKTFWNDPRVQELDSGEESIKDVVDRIFLEWLSVEEYIEECDDKIREDFCKTACEAYEAERLKGTAVHDINSELYAAWLHAQVLLGNRDFDSVIDEYYEYYIEKIKDCPDTKEMTDEDMYFVINTPMTIERWLKYSTSPQRAKEIIGVLKKQTQDTWYQKLGKYASPFVNEIMAKWCFTMLKYMDSQDEKEELVFQLLVRRQLPTYLHSVMVVNLAEALCREIKHVKPELFDDVNGIKKNDVQDFVRRCALLHDIGKTRITDIVNTQGRKLWDREFRGIRQHPIYGAEMVDADKDLAKYHDVIVGHHKFYDGSGGYPVEFDNGASNYKIIIDIITICDCIDAATDHLGRNYKVAKTLDMVLEELVAESGTRYNPEIVEIVRNSDRLKKEMRYIVSEGRLDIMYRAYLENVF